MLRSKKLSKKYNGKIALDHVDVELLDGKIYALLGPNGSGKTTFMKILSSLTRESEGEVTLDGEALSMKSRALVAYLPTESHAYPFMTVGEFGAYYKKFFTDFQETRYTEWIRRMEIPFKTPFKVLSSGMDKKVRVAATLSRNAKLLILDEPSNGLDPAGIMEIRNLITSLPKERDITVLISSHLLNEIEQMADYVGIIHKGQMLYQGKLSELESTGENLEQIFLELTGERESL